MDLLCLAAIQKLEAFEFLDEVVALLNRRPSAAAVATVEALLAGPDALGVRKRSASSGSEDPWTAMQANTSMEPVESLTGRTEGGKESYRIQQEVVRLGVQRDPANWLGLRGRFEAWVELWGAEWWSAANA